MRITNQCWRGIVFIALLLVSISLHAQVEVLSFNKRYVECEDKWVAFKMNEDSTHTYGFIYIDEAAGLTFNYEGKFKLMPNNTLQVQKIEETNMKFRLEPNNVKVAILPETMYQDLQIDSIPEWLTYYKTNVNSIERLYKWGYLYNGWNECHKALEFLLKAKSINANYEGLAVELAYSYNCLGDFNKALEILEEAIKNNPTDSYINKEYIYTLVHNNDIDKAIEQYEKSLKSKIKNTYHAENCFNILGYYYKKKDVKNFDIWVKKIKKLPNDNELITKYIKGMEEEMKKNKK